MRVDPVPHGVDHRVERLGIGWLVAAPGGGHDLADRLEHPVDGRAEQLLLAGEVVVDGRDDDVGLAGDVADRGVDEAIAGELADRRVDDVVAAGGPVGWERSPIVVVGHVSHHRRSAR